MACQGTGYDKHNTHDNNPHTLLGRKRKTKKKKEKRGKKKKEKTRNRNKKKVGKHQGSKQIAF